MNELKNHKLWWHGPPFLSKPITTWPNIYLPSPTKPVSEERKTYQQCLINKISENNDLLDKFSNLSKLLRITAYCMRWRNYKRAATGKVPQNLTQPNKFLLHQITELEAAMTKWLQLSQQNAFLPEITRITRK